MSRPYPFAPHATVLLPPVCSVSKPSGPFTPVSTLQTSHRRLKTENRGASVPLGTPGRES